MLDALVASWNELTHQHFASNSAVEKNLVLYFTRPQKDVFHEPLQGLNMPSQRLLKAFEVFGQSWSLRAKYGDASVKQFNNYSLFIFFVVPVPSCTYAYVSSCSNFGSVHTYSIFVVAVADVLFALAWIHGTF